MRFCRILFGRGEIFEKIGSKLSDPRLYYCIFEQFDVALAALFSLLSLILLPLLAPTLTKTNRQELLCQIILYRYFVIFMVAI